MIYTRRRPRGENSRTPPHDPFFRCRGDYVRFRITNIDYTLLILFNLRARQAFRTGQPGQITVKISQNQTSGFGFHRRIRTTTDDVTELASNHQLVNVYTSQNELQPTIFYNTTQQSKRTIIYVIIMYRRQVYDQCIIIDFYSYNVILYIILSIVDKVQKSTVKQ